jgi:hypothetical protein
MKGDPDRLREWAAHWASQGHSSDSGLLLARERWSAAGGGTEDWELRLADLTAALLTEDRLREIIDRAVHAVDGDGYHFVTNRGFEEFVQAVFVEARTDGILSSTVDTP